MRFRSLLSPRALLALAFSALLLAGCGDATGGSGSRGTPPLPMSPNVAATGEVTAGHPALVYGTRITPGVPFRLYLLAHGGTRADTLVAEVANGTRVLATVVGVGGERVLWNTSGEVTAPGVDSVVVRVRGQGADDAGAFSVAIVTDDPGPEHVSRLVGLGEVVDGERLDVPGERDVFRIEDGRAGDEVLVFLEWTELPLRAALSVADSSGGMTIRGGAPVEPDQEAAGTSTGRFTLSGAGPYLVTVAGLEGTGPYRLHVLRVARAPEAGPAALPVGGVTGVEAIGSAGDVDEYTVSGTAGQRVSLLMQLVSGLSGGAQLEVARGGEVLAVAHANAPGAATDDAGIGYWVFPETGAYTLRVLGPDRAALPASTGSYRLEVVAVSSAPETAGAALSLNQPVTTESIDRAGDVDEFTFTAAPGQRLVIAISSPAVPAPVLYASLVDPVIGVDVGTASTVDDGNWNIAGHLYGSPLTMQGPGPHRIRVKAPINARLARGPYRLVVHVVDAAPESRSAAVTPGTTVTGESLDAPGDLDVFILQGVPGRAVNVFLRTAAGSNGYFTAVVTGPGIASHAPYVADAGSPGDPVQGRSTGRIAMEGGEYRISVTGERGADRSPASGGYTLSVVPLDAAPETAPAAYTVGDTVKTEAIDPVGDEDEFTFTAAAGARLRWHFEHDPGPLFGLYLFVVDPRTGDRVASSLAIDANGTRVRDFTIPRAGTYVVRVSGTQWPFPSLESGNPRQQGPYRFAIVPR